MNEEEREARKSLFLKIGVFSIFILVFILWLLNLKGVFTNISGKSNGMTLDKLSSEIEQKTKTDADRLGLNQPDKNAQTDFVNKLLDKTEQVISSSTASSSASSTAILEIKKNLQDLTKDVSTSTDQAIKKNCPPYIDCMPTIGEARPCVVPPGCENITIIAY